MLGIEDSKKLQTDLIIFSITWIEEKPEIDEFRTNLREVMLYIKYSKDKVKLDEIIERDSKFQRVERQAAEVINVVTGFRLKYPEGKET